MNDGALLLPKELLKRVLPRLDYMRIQPKTIFNFGFCVEESEADLRRRYPDANVQSRVIDIRLDALSDVATASVDFAFLNLVFPAVHVLPHWLAHLRRILKPNAMLLLTSLGPDTLQELRQSFATVDAAAHTASFMDMHDVGDSLLHAGFQDPVMDREWLTLYYPDVETLMQDIQSLPFRRQYERQRIGLMTPRAWQKMVEAYERLRVDNVLPVTGEVMYGHAWIPSGPRTSRVNAEGEVVIPIDYV